MNRMLNELLFCYFVSMNDKGIDLKKIDECIGDPDADVDNAVLKAEQDAQVKLDYRASKSFLWLELCKSMLIDLI